MVGRHSELAVGTQGPRRSETLRDYEGASGGHLVGRQLEFLRLEVRALESRQAAMDRSLAEFSGHFEGITRDQDMCIGQIEQLDRRVVTLEKGQKVAVSNSRRSLQGTGASVQKLREDPSHPSASSSTWTGRFPPAAATLGAADVTLLSGQGECPNGCYAQLDKQWAGRYEDLLQEFDRLEAKVDARLEEAAEALVSLREQLGQTFKRRPSTGQALGPPAGHGLFGAGGRGEEGPMAAALRRGACSQAAMRPASEWPLLAPGARSATPLASAALPPAGTLPSAGLPDGQAGEWLRGPSRGRAPAGRPPSSGLGLGEGFPRAGLASRGGRREAERQQLLPAVCNLPAPWGWMGR